MADELARVVSGAAPWRHHRVRQAHLLRTEDGLRLLTVGATAGYSNAQIDDALAGRLIRRPPLRVELRARFSHPSAGMRGTAGFGLWNYPQAWPPAPPRAIWFLYASAPSDMPLATGVPGQGWKAATVDTGSWRALALLPLAPVAVSLMQFPGLYRRIWPPIQRAAGVAEAMLATAMDEWHEYTIDWGERTSSLWVDGVPVLAGAPSPRGPLCFVAWVDTQYLILTPQGRFAWGVLPVAGAQWLEIAALRLDA